MMGRNKARNKRRDQGEKPTRRRREGETKKRRNTIRTPMVLVGDTKVVLSHRSFLSPAPSSPLSSPFPPPPLPSPLLYVIPQVPPDHPHFREPEPYRACPSVGRTPNGGRRRGHGAHHTGRRQLQRDDVLRDGERLGHGHDQGRREQRS